MRSQLWLLALLDAKLTFCVKRTTDDVQDSEEVDGTVAQAAAAAARGKLLTKLVKKNILESIFSLVLFSFYWWGWYLIYIVPILTELKHLLEKHHSPLLKYLMAYLKELLKDYKNELQDIMVGDKLLAKELEYL